MPAIPCTSYRTTSPQRPREVTLLRLPPTHDRQQRGHSALGTGGKVHGAQPLHRPSQFDDSYIVFNGIEAVVREIGVMANDLRW